MPLWGHSIEGTLAWIRYSGRHRDAKLNELGVGVSEKRLVRECGSVSRREFGRGHSLRVQEWGHDGRLRLMDSS